MASYYSTFYIFLQIFLLAALFQSSLGSRKLSELVKEESPLMQYHNGSLLNGPITVNLIWYGRFTPSQRAILSDFVASLSTTQPQSSPSVSSWWKTTEKYYNNNNHRLSLTVGRQILNEGYSFGKSLSTQKIERLAAMGDPRNAINVVLTSADVTVDGFCMSRCGTHGASPPAKKGRFAYVWVGNSASQCPGQCAWPFHQPIYGPQSPPLVSPNGDVGVDGMVMNLASLLAGTVTNPFGDGYFQGPTEAPLEAASACPGMYGKNAYPGYAGDLLVDPTTGASYNANGELGRKYLLPALFDPTTSSCSTLV
ncbi:hypothetical protein QJS10_CPB19g01351 [Acorus calamus]|uniref:Uncharacterized protein n=1 Tax=Acorus calamus TaxID=4465 RepID=A0AAV9CGS4_ACOCL|nr:hypothetical protein QJS10_CPB19g01351 [Acorus calamus]